MSETYEKVRVSELRPGDVVQVYAFVDTDAFEITHIEVCEGVATLTVRISETDSRAHAGISIDSLVFRVKKGKVHD